MEPDTLAALETVRANPNRDVLAALVDILNDNGWRGAPPAQKSPKKKRQKAQDILTRDELDCLVAEADPRTDEGQRNRALMELLYSTGIRIGEASALTHADLDWRDGYVMVHVREGKTGARDVPAQLYIGGNPTQLQRELSRWLDREYPSEYVFPSTGTKPLNTNSINRSLKTYAERAGIGKRVHSHMFRHTFATRMYREHDALMAQRLLGHSSGDTTAIYIQSSAAEALASSWEPDTSGVPHSGHTSASGGTEA